MKRLAILLSILALAAGSTLVLAADPEPSPCLRENNCVYALPSPRYITPTPEPNATPTPAPSEGPVVIPPPPWTPPKMTPPPTST